MVDEAKKAGYEIIAIPTSLKDRIRGQQDISGVPIREMNQFYKEYRESFEFKFINLKNLTSSERKVFESTNKILNLIGGKPKMMGVVARILCLSGMRSVSILFVLSHRLLVAHRSRHVSRL